MAFQAGKGASVLHGKFDLTSYFRQASVDNEVAVLDTTTFGAAAHTFIAGLKNGTAALRGYWDGVANAVDEVIQAVLGTAGGATVVVTWGPIGTTLANPARLLSSLETKYTIEEPVDGLCAVAVDIQPDSGVDVGVYQHALAAETGAQNSASVDNGAATSNGGVAHLHVTAAVALTTATIKIQHSTDNVTWVDLVTFTAVTTTTAERVVVAAGTTVNRYTRGILSALTGTSITFATAFARR